MAHKLPPRRFGCDALEPWIDAKTMELHHDKHQQGPRRADDEEQQQQARAQLHGGQEIGHGEEAHMSHFARSLKVIAAAASVVPLAVATLVFLAPGAATAASFDSLPPGEQKIVRALYAAQSKTSLTLDQIAERRGGRQGGWGKVFKEMKAQGSVTQKNLGAVVSDYEHRNSPSSAARADKAGREDGGTKGAARSSRDDRDRGSASPSSAGGMGQGSGAGHGGGRGR